MEESKSFKRNTLIILVLTIVILFIVLKDDFPNIARTLSTMNIMWLLVSFFLFCFSIFLKGFISYKTVNEKEKYSLVEAIKHNVIVQFFNGITPFSTGGQPMEIYMLTKHKISGSKATTVIIQNFIFYQTALVLFGIGALIYNWAFNLFPENVLLKQLVALGFIINILVALGLFFIAWSKKFTNFCLRAIVKILGKVRIIKNKEKVKEEWTKKLNEFHECAKVLRKRKRLFIIGVFFNILSLACLYIIPLYLLYSIGNYSSLNIADTLVASAYVLIIGSFVPIPGATGGIEYGFLQFFGNFIKGTILSSILLVWRFITYYFPMIVGAVVFNFDKKETK